MCQGWSIDPWKTLLTVPLRVRFRRKAEDGRAPGWGSTRFQTKLSGSGKHPVTFTKSPAAIDPGRETDNARGAESRAPSKHNARDADGICEIAGRF